MRNVEATVGAMGSKGPAPVALGRPPFEHGSCTSGSMPVVHDLIGPTTSDTETREWARIEARRAKTQRGLVHESRVRACEDRPRILHHIVPKNEEVESEIFLGASTPRGYV